MRYFFIFILMAGCVREDQLSLGKGETAVLFEEFLCPACQLTINKELDAFVKQYVEKGNVHLTIIPTAFFESSRPSFAAFHQINQYHPSLLYPFLLFIYQIPQEKLSLLSTGEILRQFHTLFPEFDVNHLIETIDEKRVTRSIEANSAMLEQYYEGDMHLPTYIFKGKTIPGGNLFPNMIDSSP